MRTFNALDLPIPYGAFRAAVRHAYGHLAGTVRRELPRVPVGRRLAYLLRTTRAGGVSYHPLAALPADIFSAVRAGDVANLRLFVDRYTNAIGIDSGEFAELDTAGTLPLIASDGTVPADAPRFARRDATYPGERKTRDGVAPVVPLDLDDADVVDTDVIPAHATVRILPAHVVADSTPAAPLALPAPSIDYATVAADVVAGVSDVVHELPPETAPAGAPAAEPLSLDPEPEPAPVPAAAPKPARKRAPRKPAR